jgi:hypothetical protein
MLLMEIIQKYLQKGNKCWYKYIIDIAIAIVSKMKYDNINLNNNLGYSIL